jgi:hypothetical protein
MLPHSIVDEAETEVNIRQRDSFLIYPKLPFSLTLRHSIISFVTIQLQEIPIKTTGRLFFLLSHENLSPFHSSPFTHSLLSYHFIHLYFSKNSPSLYAQHFIRFMQTYTIFTNCFPYITLLLYVKLFFFYYKTIFILLSLRTHPSEKSTFLEM